MGFFCNTNRCCSQRSCDCNQVAGAVTAPTPQCFTLPQQCVTVPGQSVALPGQSVTLPGQSVMLPAQSVTLPAQSVTLPAQSVSLPAQRVCMPAQTVCLPQQSTTVVEAATTTTQVAGATTPRPVTVRALVNEVLDSCCDTGDVTREITVNCPEIFDPCDLEIGSSLKVVLDDDITFKEVQRDKDDCVCLSTVRFMIPVRIYGADEFCCDRFIVRNITVIRSVRLCCTKDTVLTTNNTKVLAASAVVSEICGNEIKITLSLLFRSCIQQTLVREYQWQATPVCVSDNCVDTRGSFTDPCDVICGCVAGKTCPTC